MSYLDKAEEEAENGYKLQEDGHIYAAGMCYANAAKAFDMAEDDESAHIAEDKALWCLREMCANHLGKDNIIHEIRNLAQQIAKPGPNACRFYA